MKNGYRGGMREAGMSGLAEGFGSIETATTSGFSLPLSK